jgi:hypothetical protein
MQFQCTSHHCMTLVFARSYAAFSMPALVAVCLELHDATIDMFCCCLYCSPPAHGMASLLTCLQHQRCQLLQLLQSQLPLRTNTLQLPAPPEVLPHSLPSRRLW